MPKCLGSVEVKLREVVVHLSNFPRRTKYISGAFLNVDADEEVTRRNMLILKSRKPQECGRSAPIVDHGYQCDSQFVSASNSDAL